jgi:hypothetical protein
LKNHFAPAIGDMDQDELPELEVVGIHQDHMGAGPEGPRLNTSIDRFRVIRP